MTKKERQAYERGFREGCEEGYVQATECVRRGCTRLLGPLSAPAIRSMADAVLACFRPVEPYFELRKGKMRA